MGRRAEALEARPQPTHDGRHAPPASRGRPAALWKPAGATSAPPLFPAQVSAGPPSLPPAFNEAATEVIRSRGVTWSLSGGRMGSQHARPVQRVVQRGRGSIGSRDAPASPIASK
jgi:hypothetical protein